MKITPRHTVGAPRAALRRRPESSLRQGYEWLLCRLPLLFLCWAVLSATAVAWITPAWQNADEEAHMLRAVQISLGDPLAERVGHRSGGRSDPAIDRAFAVLQGLPFHLDAKLTRRLALQEHAVRWGRPGLWEFPNTAAYPPFLYAAAVPAVLIGRLGRMRIADTLLLVRLFDAVAAACLGAAAIAVARRTRLAIAATLVLPMSLSLAASASQDALLIPVAALAVALIDRTRAQPPPPRTILITVLAAACLLTVVTARPPYILVAALPLLVPGGSSRLGVGLAVGLAAACLAWSLYVSRYLGVATLAADPGAQAVRLLHHPFVFVSVLEASLGQWWHSYVQSMVGVFGWMDTRLPIWFIEKASWAMPLGLLSAAVPEAAGRRWICSLAIVAALGSALAVFLSLYLIWSPLRSAVVLGVQGRYFLPLLPVLALGMPNLGRWATVFRPAALLAVVALALVGPAVTLATLVNRYYLAP